MFKRILLATDGSAASEHAAGIAVELARTCAARLTVLFVVDPYPYLGVGEANPMGLQAYMSSAKQLAAEAQDRVARLWSGAAADLDMRVVEDAPPAGIVRIARDMGADLVIVGSHGRSGMARLMLGSVAARVVAESPVPVLVAR